MQKEWEREKINLYTFIRTAKFKINSYYIEIYLENIVGEMMIFINLCLEIIISTKKLLEFSCFMNPTSNCQQKIDYENIYNTTHIFERHLMYFWWQCYGAYLLFVKFIFNYNFPQCCLVALNGIDCGKAKVRARTIKQYHLKSKFDCGKFLCSHNELVQQFGM